ncbi:hypothetical protein C8F01DRAFT_1094424 [Mycena amicta]|nr:hypothetical protein C8F01DRAFT_1094424 [Mycena amicta]
MSSESDRRWYSVLSGMDLNSAGYRINNFPKDVRLPSTFGQNKGITALRQAEITAMHRALDAREYHRQAGLRIEAVGVPLPDGTPSSLPAGSLVLIRHDYTFPVPPANDESAQIAHWRSSRGALVHMDERGGGWQMRIDLRENPNPNPTMHDRDDAAAVHDSNGNPVAAPVTRVRPDARGQPKEKKKKGGVMGKKGVRKRKRPARSSSDEETSDTSEEEQSGSDYREEGDEPEDIPRRGPTQVGGGQARQYASRPRLSAGEIGHPRQSNTDARALPDDDAEDSGGSSPCLKPGGEGKGKGKADPPVDLSSAPFAARTSPVHTYGRVPSTAIRESFMSNTYESHDPLPPPAFDSVPGPRSPPVPLQSRAPPPLMSTRPQQSTAGPFSTRAPPPPMSTRPQRSTAGPFSTAIAGPSTGGSRVISSQNCGVQCMPNRELKLHSQTLIHVPRSLQQKTRLSQKNPVNYERERLARINAGLPSDRTLMHVARSFLQKNPANYERERLARINAGLPSDRPPAKKPGELQAGEAGQDQRWAAIRSLPQKNPANYERERLARINAGLPSDRVNH